MKCTYLRDSIRSIFLAFFSRHSVAIRSRRIALCFLWYTRIRRLRFSIMGPLTLGLTFLSGRRSLFHLLRLCRFLRLLQLKIILLFLLAPQEDPHCRPQRLVDLAIVRRERGVFAHGARGRERRVTCHSNPLVYRRNGMRAQGARGYIGTNKSRRWPARSRASEMHLWPACCSLRSGA